MASPQAGILAPIPPLARYLTFSLRAGSDPRPVLPALCAEIDGDKIVLGIGPSLVLALDGRIAGLRSFPVHVGAGFDVPSTPAALWCWLRGNDRGELVHAARKVKRLISPVFNLEEVIDAFRYGQGLDLTGYEDGTENPQGEDAVAAAIAAQQSRGMAGSSFVAVQRWIHGLDQFQAMSASIQDLIIGRRKGDNTEIDDAPPSAHIKRTAQESFEPAAFVVRRSMPWADETRSGLIFVAFGKTFDAFEALLRRMVGVDDGIPDALFRFTRPVSGAYFWCPPVGERGLDLTALGL
jgi:putative iron-dependent peroxidase